MTQTFIHLDYSPTHAGANRLDRLTTRFAAGLQTLLSSRSLSTLLLAGAVSGLVLSLVPHLEADGHSSPMAVWVNVWAIVFAALMLLGQPIRSLVAHAQAALSAHRAHQRQCDADAQIWQWAQHDHRVMAELRAVMARD